MNEAIQQRVEQFVHEIHGLLEQARGERRAAALRVVSTMLAEVGRPSTPEATPEASARQDPPSRRRPGPVGGSRERVAKPRSGQATPPIEAAVASQARAPKGVAGPAPRSKMGAPPPNPASSAAQGPALEREVRVLGAVRALVGATAGEIAERSGQPNGSVVVALRALVARGVVARKETARGIEYRLVSSAG